MNDDQTHFTDIRDLQLSNNQGATNVANEIEKLEEALKSARLPQDLYDKAHLQFQRIHLALKYGGNINQLDMIVKYTEWIISLPWNQTTEDRLNIGEATKIMDQHHFGLTQVKKRVLEYLSVLILQRQQKGIRKFHAPILFFVGLAGTGKTTFAKSIADSLGRKFARIPFGGLSSALDLRGVSKVQPEAEPGQVIKALRRIGSRNPVILLDELDRVTDDARGAIMGVLIELLDPEQNDHYIDHYIDYPFDLSEVIFVATANNTQSISTAVMDRLEVIQMPSYTDEEKIHIAKEYILPRLLEESGLKSDVVAIDEIVWKHLARLSGYDPGIRSVERKVEAIVRTIALRLVNGQGTQFAINEQNAKEYIGA